MKSPFFKSKIVLVSIALAFTGIQAYAETATEEVPQEIIEEAPAPLGLEIMTPAGWSRTEGEAGLSVVLKEPRQKGGPRSTQKAYYQRNITVAQSTNPTPIDEKSRRNFEARLVKNLGERNGLDNFQVVESQILEYQEGKHGLLAYTTFTSNKAQLMQMHLLVSGAEKQFLITYTDLADRFGPEDEGFTAAWNSITTVSITGEAPMRYRDVIVLTGIAAIFLLLMIAFTVLRKRRFRKMYQADSFILEDNSGHEPLTGLDFIDSTSTQPASYIAPSQANTATATSSVWNI